MDLYELMLHHRWSRKHRFRSSSHMYGMCVSAKWERGTIDSINNQYFTLFLSTNNKWKSQLYMETYDQNPNLLKIDMMIEMCMNQIDALII